MSDQILPCGFYVYVHRHTNGEAFYVGKGQGRRAWNTTKRSDLWKRAANKRGLVVEIAMEGLQEWAAFELECDLIALYGRKNLGLGPLVNLSDGGEGTSGAIYSEEAKARISHAVSGTNHRMYGKKHSPETIQKMCKARAQWTMSEETCAKISKTKTGVSPSDETRAKMRIRNAGANNPNYGKKASPETRAKIAEANKLQKGKPYKTSKPLYVRELGVTFLSTTLAFEYFASIGVKISAETIRRASIDGRTSKGYTFSAYP